VAEIDNSWKSYTCFLADHLKKNLTELSFGWLSVVLLQFQSLYCGSVSFIYLDKTVVMVLVF